MSCNPCCCLSLKDAVVTIGIWSTIYSIIQLSIFGWQLAAIKYEKDRAANTLLPNYNTYGRYDIPTYYESYWQSPEERYYTWLFIIQILCLIAAFFLLFSSIMMIYGVHTWSRFLLVPWMVTMCTSILTSLAYCIIWWAGDVRDYWLMLTIIEMFGVLLNIYCFVVVVAFHQRMQAELEYYARRRKYQRFHRERETSQHTIEQDLGNSDRAINLANNLQRGQKGQQQRPIPGSIRRPTASQFPAVSPQSHQIPMRHTSLPPPHSIPVSTLSPVKQEIIPSKPQKQHFYNQRTPMERFVQDASDPPSFQNRDSFPPFEMQRSRSAQDRPFQRQNDEIYRGQERQNKFRRANSSYRYRTTCRNCGREHGRRRYNNYRYQCPRCHQYNQDNNNLTEFKNRRNSSSSLCSLAQNDEISDSLGESDRFRRENLMARRRNCRPPMPLIPQTHWSDHESDYWSGFVPPRLTNSEHNYTNINLNERAKSITAPAIPMRRKRAEPKTINEISSNMRSSPQKFDASHGFSIPQHIIIPPIMNDGTMDSQTERQYRINSEIVISYDQQPSNKNNNNISTQSFQFSSPPQSILPLPEIATIYSPQQQNKENLISKEKMPKPLERRSLKSTMLPMALTSTV